MIFMATSIRRGAIVAEMGAMVKERHRTRPRNIGLPGLLGSARLGRMASKRHLRRRQCENKIAHPTSRKAAAVAHTVGSSIYLCPFCGAWHVGRPSRKKRQRIAAARAARKKAA
jgi:hypothetical protein